MVSSANISPCTTMTSRGNHRMLNVDFNKDFSKPLLVETSVEYDLPAHIYPPKGSAPILMIHPNPPQFLRTISTNEPAAVSRPLSTLQIHSNNVINSHKSMCKPRVSCSCGNPSCNSVGSLRTNATISKSNVQPQNILSSRYVAQIPENIVYSSAKNVHLPLNGEVKSSKKHIPKSQFQKQFELHQHLQQAQLQRHLNFEKIKLQQQYFQMQQQKPSSIAPQPHNTEQMVWNLGLHQSGNVMSCQNNIAGSLPPSTSIAGTIPTCCNVTGNLPHSSNITGTLPPCCNPTEFLQPGIPPSLLARTPSRGPSGGSPKLRARSRRGLSVANTVHLPEYLGSAARSNRTVNACVSSHARTRSASMLASNPTSQPTALDVVRALTPRTSRSMFPSNQQLQSGPTTALLSTIVGQSRDSGCSLSAETLNSGMTSNETKVDWTPWSVVDSGFCTPVDTNEDQVMEPLNPSNPFISTSNLVNSLTGHKESSFGATTLNWMKNFQAPALSNPAIGKLHYQVVPQTNHAHYIPQTIWNLAY